MKYLEYNAKVYNEFKETRDFKALEFDKLAVEEFEKEVKEKMMKFNSIEERIQWLINNNYYIDFFKMYNKEDVINLHKHVYSFGFKFKSFMAISKFYNDYAMKTDDKKYYLETYEDRICAVALTLGNGDIDSAYRLATKMIKQEYQPATPTFLNAGKARGGEFTSCFLLGVEDSLNSIYHNISTSAHLSKIGGGVSLNLSNLRSRGEEIKGIKGAASGVMPVSKVLEDTFSYANQLGQRKGSGVVYLNIFHWDIEELLSSKKINADEKMRLPMLSIGVIIPDKFMELAKEGKPYYVFAPHSVFKAYGKRFDDIDMDEMYDELVNNPKVRKRKLDARKMLIEIAKLQLESGYPYIMYKGNANKAHALKGIGEIKMSNLCTEIFMFQTPSNITDYGQPDEIGYDILCNLGSLNIVNVMENKDIKGAVYAGMEALTAVSDMTNVPNAPSINKMNKDYHPVGLGAMNLHGFLAKNKIAYESEEARDFANVFFAMVNYYSIEFSSQLAKQRNQAFKDFEKSEYANGNYFKKYIENDYVPKTEKVKKLFEGIYIPSRKDWAELAERVKKYGLYHGYRQATAPTGSISYVQNATASVMPITAKIERRTYGNSETVYPMPFLSPETFWFYKEAYDMNMYRLIDLIATIQEHVDQGISCTLFVKSDISTRELARYYVYAWMKGLKSLYYTRTKKLDVSECVSCTV